MVGLGWRKVGGAGRRVGVMGLKEARGPWYVTA